MHEKPKYNLFQNSWYMVCLAWRYCKSVLAICIILAAATAGETVVQLLIAPGILQKLELRASLPQLLGTIAIFTGALILFAAAKEYFDLNKLFGRVTVRIKLIEAIAEKMASTSYENLLDTAFLQRKERASSACDDNQSPAENIWLTWTNILANLLGFAVYLALLSSLSPLLILVVIATTVAGYFVSRRVNQWGYLHREEEASYAAEMRYVKRTVTSRAFAKDIRIFGLKPWLMEVWQKSFRLYESFFRRREKHYFLTNLADFLLSLLRNGIPYVTKRRPDIRTLSLTLSQEAVARPGKHFQVSSPGDTVDFSHGGREYRLTVQEYAPQVMDWSKMPMKNAVYPSHYMAMTYTLSPEMPDGVLELSDCAESDQPRREPPAPGLPTATSDVAVIGIIGGADGPTSIVPGQTASEKLHAACSALHFAPANSVEWRMVFRETQYADFTLDLLP